MKTVLFGFSGSGKSELFAALAGPGGAPAGGRVMAKVPEPRLEPLVALYSPKKVTLAEMEFLDMPGGGERGRGLGNRVLTAIRPADCLLAVLDAFSGLDDPQEQWQAIETDLLVADLAVVEKRLERLALDKKKNKDLVDPAEEAALERVQACLESEKPLREDPELAAAHVLRGFQFLSAKPVLWAWNCPEAEVADRELPPNGPGQAHLAVSARLEHDLAELEDPEERAMFLADAGLTASALDRVLGKVFELLGLISFFTTGPDEVRAWPVRRGSLAPEAAGAIHSDIQKGVIRAEVTGYEDFAKAGSLKRAKELGQARLEGREYVVQDGDIVEFRFNV